jgi:type I restriction enzyme S subunit
MNKEKKNMMVPRLRFPEFIPYGGWEERTLGNICSNIASGKDSIYENGEFDLYGSTGIIGKTDRGSYEGSFILVARVGANAGFLNRVEGKFGVTDNTLILFLYEFENIDFVYYTLEKIGLNKLVFGSGQPLITGGQLKNLLSNFPQPTEQQKIASCLSSLDDLITAHTEKLDALKAHKKGLMQELFPAEGKKIPKRRFEEFKDSEEWVTTSLIDVANKKTKWSFTGGPFGSNLKSSDYIYNGIRVIQLQNIGDGEFLDEYKIYTSVQKADELLSCNIYPGEIILSKMGDPVGRACLIPETSKRYVMCSDGIRLVVDEQRYSKYFIYSIINSKHFRPLIEKAATGSTRKRIGLDDLKNLPMLTPIKLEEQQKIANCLFSLDELITEQAKKIEQLKLHKKGLMQELFPKTTK